MRQNDITVSKPTIFDRIVGYFRMKRYMRKFERERALRTAAIEEMRREYSPILPS